MSQLQRIKLARIERPHGLKGEVKIKAFTDEVDRFKKYPHFFLDERSEDRVEPEYFRGFSSALIVKFKNICTREEAGHLVGLWLYLKRKDIAHDGVLIEDFIGLTAITPDGNPIGKILCYYDCGKQDLLEVSTCNGKKLVPCLSSYWGTPSSGKVVLTDHDGLLGI